MEAERQDVSIGICRSLFAIRDATWIIVLEQGRIIEHGRHAELLAAGGRYWALLNRQQLEESIEEDGDTELAEPSTEDTINA